MKDFSLYNIVIGIIVILESLFLPLSFYTIWLNPIFFIAGLLNLFLGFGLLPKTLEWYQKRKEKNTKVF